MRAAPTVHLDCAEDRAWRVLQVLLITATALSFGYWLLAWTLGPGKTAALVSAGVACAAAWLAVRGTRQPTRHLAWDGTQWTLESPPMERLQGQLTVAFDLGGWVLLRFAASDGPQVVWLPLTRSAAGGAWHGLNVALHAQQAQVALPRRQADRAA